MEGAGGGNWKRVLLTLPWAVVRFFGRITRGVFVAVGVIVALLVLGYVGLEEIFETIDSHYAKEIDDYLGIDRSTIARLRDRAYFAQESTLVTEDLKTAACISSPEHRILINDVADVPPLFVSAILASEDKNFFKHEGIDKAAILRAFAKHLLQESRSGASTLTMQIAKHLRGGTGRASTEMEKIGDIVMALRIEREFSRQDLLVKYVNMPYFGRGQYGIEAASRAYFGKPAKDLTLPQVAFIVALINKPALPDRTFATDPLLEHAGTDPRCELGRAGARHGPRARPDAGPGRDRRRRVRAGGQPGRDVAPQGCSSTGHRLRHERPLSRAGPHPLQGSLPDHQGRTHDLDHARRRAAGRARERRQPDARDVSRPPSRRHGQQPAARRSVRGRIHRRCARRGGQCRFQATEVRRHRDRLAAAGIDVQDLHVRRPGRATHEGGARRRAEGVRRCDRRQSPRALHRARRAGVRFAGPRTRNEEDRKLPLALGAGVPRRDQLPDRAGRVAQHGGDARGRTGRHQERHRSRVSHRTAEGFQASAAALSDDGHRRLRGESAVDGLYRGVPERRISRDAALRERRLPRRQVAPLQGRRPTREGLRHQRRKPSRPRSGSCIPPYRRR